MKARTNGSQVNYEIHGDSGPWVVLSHSLACNLRMWDGQVAVLKERYRVLAYDTRGHGESDASPGGYTFDHLVEDLRSLLDAAGVRDPHFVGLSMGGMIGMSFALKYPGRFRSLVLCDTSSRIPPEAGAIWEQRIRAAAERGMEPLVEPTIGRWFTEPFLQKEPATISRIADMIRSTPTAGYIGCCHAIPKINVTDRLDAIKCPVQIIVGEQDVGTPVAMSEAIQKAIPGSELVVIPNASHLSNVEQPEKFNQALSRFLSTH